MEVMPQAFTAPGGIGAEIDVTVMAYAQWLTEVKEQSSNARYHHQVELDLVRDAITASNGELMEFKRHSSQIVQQLQVQVAEIRAKMTDVFSDIGLQGRHRQEVANTVQVDPRTGAQTLSEQIERLQVDIVQIASSLRALESDVSGLQRALSSCQDHTLLKFGEADKAINILHEGVSGVRQELLTTKGDCKRGQELLGDAINTISKDVAEFQRHTSAIVNKLQCDVYQLDAASRSRMRDVDELHQAQYPSSHNSRQVSERGSDAGLPQMQKDVLRMFSASAAESLASEPRSTRQDAEGGSAQAINTLKIGPARYPVPAAPAASAGVTMSDRAGNL